MWITSVEFPYHGVITHWRFWRARSVPFRAMVLRNVDTICTDTLYIITGINDIPKGDTNQRLTYQVPDDERISVLAGDVIGFTWSIPALVNTWEGDANDDEVEDVYLKYNVSPDGFSVNDTIDTRAFTQHWRKAYSMKAIVSGIVTIYHKT